MLADKTIFYEIDMNLLV